VIDTYDRSVLIKPDVDDPRRFIEFTGDGYVRARRGLPAADATRATETIRVFALDAWSLRTARLPFLAEPLRLAQEAAALTFDDANELLVGYANDYRGSAYEAAIFDVFGVV
jgi:hypothetical protein